MMGEWRVLSLHVVNSKTRAAFLGKQREPDAIPVEK